MDEEATYRNLSVLTIKGAVEIDSFLLGKKTDFAGIKKLAEILRRYQPKGTEDFLSLPRDFPYMVTRKAISNKRISNISELALEIRLFRSELEHLPRNRPKLEELRNFLSNLSREYLAEREYVVTDLS